MIETDGATQKEPNMLCVKCGKKKWAHEVAIRRCPICPDVICICWMCGDPTAGHAFPQSAQLLQEHLDEHARNPVRLVVEIEPETQQNPTN